MTRIVRDPSSQLRRIFTDAPQFTPHESERIEGEAVRDATLAFDRAYHAAMCAKAGYQQKLYAGWNDPGHDIAARHRRAVDAALTEFVRKLDLFIGLPAMSKAQLRRKRGAIGRVWLTARGEPRYDAYRAAVARDAQRLGVPGNDNWSAQ